RRRPWCPANTSAAAPSRGGAPASCTKSWRKKPGWPCCPGRAPCLSQTRPWTFRIRPGPVGAPQAHDGLLRLVRRKPELDGPFVKRNRPPLLPQQVETDCVLVVDDGVVRELPHQIGQQLVGFLKFAAATQREGLVQRPVHSRSLSACISRIAARCSISACQMPRALRSALISCRKSSSRASSTALISPIRRVSLLARP